MAEKSSPKKLQIKYVKSMIGYSEKHKRTIKALGFTKLNQVIVREDSPSLQGMIHKVNHLVQVEELED